MRLHVRKFRAEELARTINRKLLGFIDDFAAAIPALRRIALGIFVGQARALRRHHRTRGEVLARDEFDVVLLARFLFENDLRNRRIARAHDVRSDLVQRVHLAHATRMTSAGERCGEKCIHDLLRIADGSFRAAEAEHVRVVVLANF